MGYSRWSSTDWDSHATTTRTKSAAEIFTSRRLNEDLNPKGVIMRESRDSDANPQSTPIIIGVDVTGSMGMIADYFIKTGVGKLFEDILDRKPVTDPHLMIMGIGDATCDDSPIQVSQFEADLTIVKQLEKIHIEHGGGPNGYESYELPWYFAANHTSIDSMEKRNKKGYLFTIGDEPPSRGAIIKEVKTFIGDTLQADISLNDLYEQVSKMYNTYHIIVAEGSYCRARLDQVVAAWTGIMGQNAIVLSDYHELAQVIESIIEVNEGTDASEVIASWSGSTALAVKTAVSGLSGGLSTVETGSVTRF